MPARISFVCQNGEIEPKAVLLAASLRLHFPAGLKLVAAHPHRHGPLTQTTISALDDLDVEIAGIENPLHDNYLIGHKLAALALLEGTGLGLFLDSDILAMRPPEQLPVSLAAVPASSQHCPLHIWHYIYERFDLDFPVGAPATFLTEETTAPYFNTGFIAIPGEMAARFAAVWADCAQQIDTDPLVPSEAKRPYLDQTSFPIAAALLGVPIKALDEKWNFRGWGWHLPEESHPVFYHYQEIRRLSRQPNSLEAVQAAQSISPAVAKALQDVI